MGLKPDLLPCPFCGGEATILYSEGDPRPYNACCDTPCCLGNNDCWFESVEDAIYSWNKRNNTPFRKLVEGWERFDSNIDDHPPATWAQAKVMLKERTNEVRRLLKRGE